MVRVFYPKGTDFTNISDEEIQNVFKIINLKPRKSL
jgi:IS30 family transposase